MRDCVGQRKALLCRAWVEQVRRNAVPQGSCDSVRYELPAVRVEMKRLAMESDFGEAPILGQRSELVAQCSEPVALLTHEKTGPR